MLKKILVFLLLAFPIVAIADDVFYIKINNKSNYDAVTSIGKENGDTENWECGDFCNSQIIPANSSKDFRVNTRAFNAIIKDYTGIQTVNINYGQVAGKVQFWVDHTHPKVATNVKTAVIGSYLPLGSCSNIVMVSAGVATDTDSIMPDIYVENINIGFMGMGTAHITLMLS